jgi:dihydrofolate reductase
MTARPSKHALRQVGSTTLDGGPVRKIVVHMQSTLDNRIANAQGAFWEPFPWGEPEVAYVNQFFRTADTWALSRVMYDAIVPWWDGVATGQLPADAPEITPAFAEFAQLQRRMTKVVFSNAMQSGDGRIVIRGDLAGQLAKLKQQDGDDIILSCGPATLGPIASTPGLVDEYLIAVHPAVITAGPRMFDRLSRGLALELVHAEVFDAGSVVLQYRAIPD